MKAVLFDLDGTLLDTLEDLADSTNAVLSAHGFPGHPVARYRTMVGDGAETLLRRALPPALGKDPDAVRRFTQEMRAEYDKRWNLKTKPYAGVPEALERIGTLGVKRAVLSNKPDSFVGKILRYYLPGVAFDAAFGQKPGAPVKPDPAGALEISMLLGVQPNEFLYLGDTNTDMRTAHAAGMFPVGALWGFRTEEELLQSGAAAIVKNPLDILQLLEGTQDPEH